MASQALDCAHSRKLRSLRLSCAISLAELWLSHGRRSEALEVLEPAYHSIREGAGTRDGSQGARAPGRGKARTGGPLTGNLQFFASREKRMSKLKAFGDENDVIEKNKLLFDWLSDDHERAQLYVELKARASRSAPQKPAAIEQPRRLAEPGRTPLLSKKSTSKWRSSTAASNRIKRLDSGGRFMLGLDSGEAHTKQNRIAVSALKFTQAEIESVRRESLRPCVGATPEESWFQSGGRPGRAGRAPLCRTSVRLS